MPRSNSHGELLPAACLVGIFAGFVSFLLFGDDLLICLLAAGVGAVVGAIVAGGEESEVRYSPALSRVSR